MGFYPLPAALSGYPPRGVSAAQGRLMPLAFAAHSALRSSCVRILHANAQKAPHLYQARGFSLRVGDGDRTHDDRNHNPGLYH